MAYVTQYMKRLFFYYVAWWIVYIPITSYGLNIFGKSEDENINRNSDVQRRHNYKSTFG